MVPEQTDEAQADAAGGGGEGATATAGSHQQELASCEQVEAGNSGIEPVHHRHRRHPVHRVR